VKLRAGDFGKNFGKPLTDKGRVARVLGGQLEMYPLSAGCAGHGFGLVDEPRLPIATPSAAVRSGEIVEGDLEAKGVGVGNHPVKPRDKRVTPPSWLMPVALPPRVGAIPSAARAVNTWSAFMAALVSDTPRSE
jgi:hypothetical protein